MVDMNHRAQAIYVVVRVKTYQNPNTLQLQGPPNYNSVKVKSISAYKNKRSYGSLG